MPSNDTATTAKNLCLTSRARTNLARNVRNIPSAGAGGSEDHVHWLLLYADELCEMYAEARGVDRRTAIVTEIRSVIKDARRIA